MNPDENPEQRIADLERPLLQSAADSELSADRPRVGLRLGWIALALMLTGLVVAGGAILAGRAGTPVSGRPTSEPMLGGGGTVAESPSPPTPSHHFPGSEVAPTPTSILPPASTASPGETISVSGVGNERTIDCTNNAVSVSGVDNKVALNGHCSRVTVSGVRNTVTVDAADAIVVSGMNNAVTFHSGTPQLENSGIDNSLERG
jgi:hypothetical protein